MVIYDFGCVRSFDAATVSALARLLGAVRRDDSSAMWHALAALSAVPPKDKNSQAHMRALLRGFFAPLLHPGPHAVEPGAGLEAKQILSDKRALIRLALPGKLLFLFRLRFGLYAVLSRLQAVGDWSALECEGATTTQG